jgi:hypothetical protein
MKWNLTMMKMGKSRRLLRYYKKYGILLTYSNIRFDEDEFDQDNDSDLSEMSDLSDDEDDDDEDIEDEDMMHRHHYHSGMEDDEVCICFLTYWSFHQLDHFQPHLHGHCSNHSLSFQFDLLG